MRPSLMSTTASCAATDTSPAIGQGYRKRRGAVQWPLAATTHAPFGAEVERNVEQSYGSFGGCSNHEMLGEAIAAGLQAGEWMRRSTGSSSFAIHPRASWARPRTDLT